MNTVKCPVCQSSLYKGEAPMTLHNVEGTSTSVEIEVVWCNTCEKVLHADWT